MLSMGPILDLDHLKNGFSSLVTQAEPGALSSFMIWLDLKVSEFKVTGGPPNKTESSKQDSRWVNPSLQEKCNSMESSETAESTGRQTSPAHRPHIYNQSHPETSPIHRPHIYSESHPQDLSRKRCHYSQNSYSHAPNKHLSDHDQPSRKSLKSIIDNIVRKETLSDIKHDDRKKNGHMSHMELPLSMPLPPPHMGAIMNNNLAMLLSSGIPMLPGPYSGLIPMPKHPLAGLGDLSAPHKKFRYDLNPPAEEEALGLNLNPPAEEALCLKKSSSPPVLQTDQACFPQPQIKTEVPSPVKDDSSEKENSDACHPPVNSQVTSALRELLTAKRTSQQQDEVCDTSRKLFIDEDTFADSPESDFLPNSPSTEDECGDKTRMNNTCQVCGQSFQYRSSFRRHMKVHQGIFSHVCAVCARKFTRKEHFVRHKCSRKPNKASRGALCDISASPSAPKVEFPPPQSSPSYRSETSFDGSLSEYPDSPLVPAVKTNMESRRKAALPRKVVIEPVQETYDDDSRVQEAYDNDSREPQSSPSNFEVDRDAYRHEAMMEQDQCSDPPSPTDNPPVDDYRPTYAGSESRPVYPTPEERPEEDEALDLSCPQVTSSLSPPQVNPLPDPVATHHPEPALPTVLTQRSPDPASPAPKMPTQQEFTIDTGSYKVVTGAGEENDPSDRGNNFIKVVKQGNYLKLKEEAQVIAGQLCFVCPTCGKIFHRSSNFSRHMRIHRGVYSYVCPNCQRGFFRREHFQKHKCSRRGMSHTWDRKTKIDMVLAANEECPPDSSDAEAGSDIAEAETGSDIHETGSDIHETGSDIADSEESYQMSVGEMAEENRGVDIARSSAEQES